MTHHQKALLPPQKVPAFLILVLENDSQLQIYFAHPYHSWERGTNENTNGLLRFYFPKQMSFSNLTQRELDAAVLEINTRPRKRLGYKTPSQVLKVSGAIRIGV